MSSTCESSGMSVGASCPSTAMFQTMRAEALVLGCRWDQGVAGMRVGDKRRLTVPPQMGYGSAGVKGVIPGNTALQFDVELCDVKG